MTILLIGMASKIHPQKKNANPGKSCNETDKEKMVTGQSDWQETKTRE